MEELVRKLEIDEYNDFLQIAFNAYPGIWVSAEEKEKFTKWFNLYGSIPRSSAAGRIHCIV